MRCMAFLVMILLLCVSCATGSRYQLPQTAAGLEASVSATETSYRELYRAFKAGAIRTADMGHIDALYRSWRAAQDTLVDAVHSGAVGFTTE